MGTPIPVVFQPGIRRDGTALEGNHWLSGQWTRFQRGKPRKMRGYRIVTSNLTNPSRGIHSQTLTGYSYIHSGHVSGIDSIQITPIGLSSSPFNRTPSGFVADPAISWQFDTIFDPVSSLQQIIGVANYGGIDSSNGVNGNAGNLNVYNGNIYGSSPLTPLVLPPFAAGGVAAISAITAANPAVVTVSGVNPIVTGQTVMITGVLGTMANVLNNTAVASVAVSGQNITLTGVSTLGLTYTSGGSIGFAISGISGGVCVLNPYTILYGNNGYWAWSDPSAPLNFITQNAGQTNVTTQKILRGLPLRAGGGYSPAGLFWSIDALIRATFTGGVSTSTWQWDTLSAQVSLLGQNCVVEDNGTFYWVGADGKFYQYNGIVREIPNAMNLNWFFDNINQQIAAKCFAMRVPRWGEIWFCFPFGSATECSWAVIYNTRENSWYDTMLPSDGRTAGLTADASYLTLQSDATSNGTGASFAVSAVTKANPAVVTATGHTFLTGESILFNGVGGMTQLNGNTYTVVSVAGANFTIAVDTTSFGVYTSGGTAQQQLYNLHRHEVGTDNVNINGTNPIDAFIETGVITRQEGQQPDNQAISSDFMEPDIIQSGNMTVTVRGKTTESSPNVDSQPYTIFAVPTADPATQVVPLKETRRQMRLKFESNTLGGDFQIGKCLLHVQPDSERMTT